jgi:hypothetical protein
MKNKDLLKELNASWKILKYEEWKNSLNNGPKGWFAVYFDDGIVAYFKSEENAARFIMTEIEWMLKLNKIVENNTTFDIRKFVREFREEKRRMFCG